MRNDFSSVVITSHKEMKYFSIKYVTDLGWLRVSWRLPVIRSLESIYLCQFCLYIYSVFLIHFLINLLLLNTFVTVNFSIVLLFSDIKDLIFLFFARFNVICACMLSQTLFFFIYHNLWLNIHLNGIEKQGFLILVKLTM